MHLEGYPPPQQCGVPSGTRRTAECFGSRFHPQNHSQTQTDKILGGGDESLERARFSPPTGAYAYSFCSIFEIYTMCALLHRYKREHFARNGDLFANTLPMVGKHVIFYKICKNSAKCSPCTRLLSCPAVALQWHFSIAISMTVTAAATPAEVKQNVASRQ